MGSATKGALIVHRSVVPFHNLGSPTDQFKCLIVKYDLDFDLVTFKVTEIVDFVHTNLPYQYGENPMSLRQ